MKRGIAGAIAVLVITLIVGGCGHSQKAENWISLIDGNSGMDNWGTSGSKANWRAEDGAIQADKMIEGKGRSEERRVGKESPYVCRSRWSPYH